MTDPKLAETPDEIAAQIMKSYLDREYLYSHGARRNMLISDISAALEQKDGRIRDLEQSQPTEEYWDQNAVQCGNCSVEILTRKGEIAENNGLSNPDAGSEDEHLCGRCAGDQMYEYQDRLEVLEQANKELLEALRDSSDSLTTIQAACALSGLPPKVWAGMGSKGRTALSKHGGAR